MARRIPQIGIVMASDKDLPSMRKAAEFLHALNIPFEMTVLSPYRTPDKVREYGQAAERNGYEVAIAADGREALARAEEDDAPLDLLITDVVMPALGGPELARRLRQRFPDLAVLFVSGYPRDFQTGETPGDEAFLHKPFTQEQLLASIAKLLGEPRDGPRR